MLAEQLDLDAGVGERDSCVPEQLEAELGPRSQRACVSRVDDKLYWGSDDGANQDPWGTPVDDSSPGRPDAT